MRIENGEKIRNERGSNVPTKMVGFRAEPQVFEMIEKARKAENLGRSEFILRVLIDYCTKYNAK